MYDEWGITDGYFDVGGTWRPTSDAARATLRDAMGVPREAPPMWFVRTGDGPVLLGPCRLVVEGGHDWGEIDRLPTDVPLGYHDLMPLDGGPTTRLVIHPTTCPPVPRAWGVAAQLYALWSERSWGAGDLHDLAALASRVRAAGGAALLVSPLHQPAPSFPQQPSPYYPSSRRAWSPLLIGMDDAPSAALRIDPSALIDRDAIWRAKRAALEAQFAASSAPPPLPDTIAVFNALCDEHGSDWSTWPAGLDRCDRGSIADALRDDGALAARATFHRWCQDRFREQLDAVSAAGVDVIGDLAVGFSPYGADAWEHQHLLALDMRVGAPPDPFNSDGQEWGIPPFVPWRLRAARFEPFIATIRACLRGVQGLRIDHVMGLFRQFWIPAGAPPSHGAYVTYPAEELLAIVCLEATRSGAFVIGEDLGTVEPRVREALARCGIAGTKVLWFEPEAPAAWPEQSLATITTHDLPTIAAVLTDPTADTDGDKRERLLAAADAPPDAAATDDVDVLGLITAAHRALLRSPAALRLVTSDDLCGAVGQPNRPGTDDERNWRTPLPVSVDDIDLDTLTSR